MFLAILSIAYSSVYYVISILLTIICGLHTVLPVGLDVALFGVAAYYVTRLKRPDERNVQEIFGPIPGSKESLLCPEKVVKCIAHRGAGFDAPENTLEAFKYVSLFVCTLFLKPTAGRESPVILRCV